MIKLNAKIGVAAVIAALFVAFGAFGLGGVTNTSAGALPPVVVSQGPCTPNGGTPGAAIPASGVASGTVLCVRAAFSGVGNPITVTQSFGAGTSASNLTLLRAVAIASQPDALVVELNPWAADDNASANVYEQTAATQLSYSLFQIQVLHSLAYDLTTTVSCPNENAANGSITFTAAQSLVGGGSGLASTSATVTCITPKSNVLSIKKIDQVGAIKGATFAVQQEVGVGNWVTIATMVTSSSSTASNPCLSTGSCTTNPSSPAAGQLPPWCEQATNTCNGVTLPSGVALRVIEVGQPANCTLVEIRDGDSDLRVQPVTFSDISTASLNDRTLTWTNSCVLPGGPSGSASSIAVVIGGATFGLSNTTHVEIIPAPGSDDDARIDIRARDVNNVIIPNAHVTVSVDKGRIAMRTDLSGPGPSGYEVIEPAPGGPGFGSHAYGDTCDQTIGQFNANVYNGVNTNPFIASSPSIQDGFTNADGIISACYYVNPDIALGITPGKATVTVIIETPQSPQYIFGSTNIILTASITVVGPPASIKVAASPTSVQCGEKSTITATVTDSVGQNVSDHTRVELVSNFGATIGGTGSTLGFPGVGAVNPLSSSAAETFSGVATAFLLTSTEHVGPYEVVVASGGSVGLIPPGSTQYTAGTGVFSTAPVSAQVTVTCALPVVAAPIAAAPIAAPRTGEGIRPPNTGDAGLADASGNSSTLFIIGGLVAFAVAGLSLKLARR